MHWYDFLLVIPLAWAAAYLWRKMQKKGGNCGSCSACPVACKKSDEQDGP